MDSRAFVPSSPTFPGLTVDELRAAIANGSPRADAMAAEIDRRARVAAGDIDAMTAGERLRFVKAQRGA